MQGRAICELLLRLGFSALRCLIQWHAFSLTPQGAFYVQANSWPDAGFLETLF